MLINGIGSNISAEKANDLSRTQRKLDTNHIQELQKNRDLNITGVEVDLSHIPEPKTVEDTGKVKLAGDTDQSSSNDFETLINHMKGLSDEQKTTLQNAVNAASDTLGKSEKNSDTFGMRIAQTDLEFKYISKKIVPEEYQASFNTIAEEYTKKQSDGFVNFEKYFAEDLINRTDDLSTKMGWQQLGRNMRKSIEAGTDQFHTEEKKFQNMYSSIDVSKSDGIKTQVDNVYKSIMSDSSSSNAEFSSEIRYLTEKWNGVMDALGDKSNKFTTSVNYLA